MLRLLRALRPNKDPYWDQFVNRPFSDPKNMVLDLITSSPGGGVFGVKMDVHDQLAMAGHMLQLAKFWGADAAAVTRTDPDWFDSSAAEADGTDNSGPGESGHSAGQTAPLLPNAIVCGVRRDFAETARGMGGMFAEQRLAVCNFNLRSYIREIGYSADFATPASIGAVAAAAGLGALTSEGRFISKAHRDRLVLAQLVLTDLPMAPRA
jgi:hypothetical protein